MDVADWLRLAHFANAIRFARVSDIEAEPTVVRNVAARPFACGDRHGFALEISARASVMLDSFSSVESRNVQIYGCVYQIDTFGSGGSGGSGFSNRTPSTSLFLLLPPPPLLKNIVSRLRL